MSLFERLRAEMLAEHDAQMCLRCAGTGKLASSESFNTGFQDNLIVRKHEDCPECKGFGLRNDDLRVIPDV